MNNRDRERERDRRAAAATRNNEYFLPKDGIDREVITSDICRYLGNDALVRPGRYDNPNTRQSQDGYFITAYRNLTTEMIADLKADSERWDKERRQTASGIRGPSNVGYRESTTHQSRQYYGPSEPMSGPPQGGYVPATAGPVIYNDGSPYPPQQQPLQQQSYSQQSSASGYQQPGYPAGQDYYAGANYSAAEPSPARVPVSQAGVNVPRTSANNVSYAVTPTYQQPDNRGPYYSNQTQVPVSSGPAYPSQQPQDPYYGRGAYYHETKPPIYIEKRELSNFLATPATDPMYAQDTYDTRPNYQESGSYSQTQAPVSQSVPAVVPNTSSRREHHPEPRERHGHRNNNRRN